MKKIVLGIIIAFLFIACSTNTTNKGDRVIDKAIEFAGGDLYENSKILFRFRGDEYASLIDGGRFVMTKTVMGPLGNRLVGQITNDGFVYFKDRNETDVDEKKLNSVENQLNSVIYFALLPYGLQDEAVINDYIGEVTIEGKKHHKVKITFTKKNGGEDFTDEFVYFFAKNNYQLKYFAYKYYTNEGGIRFRKAKNGRNINGIFVQDYINYAPKDEANTDIMRIENDFEEGKLEVFSEIILTDVEVQKAVEK